MLAKHCDVCDTWSRINTDLPVAWVDVFWGGRELHFCLPDCLLKFFARVEPTVTVGAE